ncbi:MAG: LysR family transcriptional regulator [Rhizobiaceae bacterium]|nr:LysR family transcriptional regulator [Rhizobiaceae bacterium]
MANISDMAVFANVVASGGLTAAGRQLGMSPAVVSKRLRKLEEQLGARLLHRTTRQVSLTEAGQGYYDRVVEILADIEKAESFVSRRSEFVRGILKISAPTTFGRLHIAPHLHKFMRNNTDLTVNLDLSDRFVDIVGEGFDVAIRIGTLDDSTLVAKKLASVRRVLCASPDYLQSHAELQHLQQLDEHHCLATHNQNIWKLEGPEGPVDYRVNGDLQTNSSEVVREAVITGSGIALRSTWDVGPELASGKLKILLSQYTGNKHAAVYALYPTRSFLPAKVRAFIEFLAELYGPNPYWDRGLV